jgi:hypothetical protein
MTSRKLNPAAQPVQLFVQASDEGKNMSFRIPSDLALRMSEIKKKAKTNNARADFASIVRRALKQACDAVQV